MRQICCLYEVSSCNKTHWTGAMQPRQIDTNLTEEDILFLQDIFLTNGLHHIKVPSVLSGRTIIYKFLRSMNYYHHVTCLTCNDDFPLKKTVGNLFQLLKRACGQEPSYEHIENYFLEQWFADFMWVELSEDLITNGMVIHALHAMHELDLAHHIPIISVSCNC